MFIANLVMAETVERQVVNNMFSDTPLGIFVIRGDNVVVMGDVVSVFSAAQPWFWNFVGV
jgi:hypothetical protein